jgi:hypothetical protein
MNDWLLYQQYLSISEAFGVDIYRLSAMMRQFLCAGTPQYNVTLKVKVSSDCDDDGADKPCKAGNFELSADELRSVFLRFGEINTIETEVEHDCGYVTFKHLISAVVALLTYHQWFLPQTKAFLLLFIVESEESDKNAILEPNSDPVTLHNRFAGQEKAV